MLPVEAHCSWARFQIHALHFCQLIQRIGPTGVDHALDKAAVAKNQGDGGRLSI